MRRALLIALIPMSALPGCGLFAGGQPIVTTQAAGCSSLIPEAWRQGVEGADPPLVESVIADWIAFGDAQTGKLDVANDRTTSTIDIVSRCEVRDAAAVRRATRRKFLGIF